MFRAAIDIANRALDHIGADPIDETLGFTENSRRAAFVGRVYDKLRQAELRRNAWRFAIRKAVLRAIDTDTMLLDPALWVVSTTYFVGSVVSDENGQLWISVTADNLGNQPETSTTWQQYFGPLTVYPYDSTTAYFAGELVYTADGDGTYRVFMSLESGNDDDPSEATDWDSTATYKTNDVVTYSSVAYMSLVDLNINQQPDTHPSQWTSTFVGGTGSVKWRQIGGAEFPMGVGLKTFTPIYPLGSGPSSQQTSRNIFRLPAGYLRMAPQDPKAGANSYLGAPTGAAYNDWEFESNFIISSQTDPIVFRFVTDTVDVTTMDPMFCEGLAARIGFEGCETLTQSVDKKKLCASVYQEHISAARLVNGIEIGSEEPPLDDYVATRL